MPGFYYKHPSKPLVWIQFHYERLFEFCFNCGCLGHSIKFCSLNSEQRRALDVFGLIMRASFVEYRIFTGPDDLLKKMETMSLQNSTIKMNLSVPNSEVKSVL